MHLVRIPHCRGPIPSPAQNVPRKTRKYLPPFHLIERLGHFSTEFRKVLRQTLVAGTMYGLKMYKPRRFSLEFLTQPEDVVIHRSRAWVVLVPLHFIQ